MGFSIERSDGCDGFGNWMRHVLVDFVEDEDVSKGDLSEEDRAEFGPQDISDDGIERGDIDKTEDTREDNVVKVATPEDVNQASRISHSCSLHKDAVDALSRVAISENLDGGLNGGDKTTLGGTTHTTIGKLVKVNSTLSDHRRFNAHLLTEFILNDNESKTMLLAKQVSKQCGLAGAK